MIISFYVVCDCDYCHVLRLSVFMFVFVFIFVLTPQSVCPLLPVGCALYYPRIRCVCRGAFRMLTTCQGKRMLCFGSPDRPQTFFCILKKNKNKTNQCKIGNIPLFLIPFTAFLTNRLSVSYSNDFCAQTMNLMNT